MQGKGHNVASLILPMLMTVCTAAEVRAEEDGQGWHISPLPIIGYSSDFGFQLGASADIFNPQHRIHLDASYWFDGMSMVNADYFSGDLIPGIHFSASFSWQKNPLSNFYGFGGDVVTYDSSIDRRNGIAYYSNSREMIRFVSSFRGRISGNLLWTGGLSVWHYNTGDTRYRNYDGSRSLYHFYRETGVIYDDEVKGTVMELSAGLEFDSREGGIAPSRGIYAGLCFNAAPDLFGTGYPYVRMCARFRHYLTPGPDWLTFAYHLAYQGIIAGKAPFYMLPNICSFNYGQTYMEGLGGQSTLRGVLSERLTGNGYAWGNAEIRIRLFKFDIGGLGCSVGINPFFDAGAIVQPYKISEISKATGESEEELRKRSGRLHCSAGMGLKFGVGSDYMLSLEAGKAFNGNDGPLGIALSINYIF